MNEVLSFLAKRLCAPPSSDGAARSSSFELDRRRFLLSSGAVGAVSISALRSSSPRLFLRGRSLVLEYAGYSWEIETQLFGPSAQAVWRQINVGFVEFHLRRAFLPGTDLNVSFDGSVEKRGGIWFLSISIPALNFFAEATFLEWLSGATVLNSRIPPRRISVGAASIRVEGDEISLKLIHPFRLSFSAGNICSSIKGAFAGTSLLLEVVPTVRNVIREMLEMQSSVPATRFSLGASAQSKTEFKFDTADNSSIAIQFDGISSIEGEAFPWAGKACAVELYDGPARLQSRSNEGDDAGDVPVIFLERAAMLADHDGNAALVARIARYGHSFDFGTGIATISGDDQAPLVMRARERACQTISCEVRLHAFDIPVEGGGIGRMTFSGRIATISIPGADDANLGTSRDDLISSLGADDVKPTPAAYTEEKPTAAAAVAHSPRNLIVLGREPFVLLELDAARLELRRPVDLFRLAFTFDGFRVRVRDNRAILERHREHGVFTPAKIGVTFQPQHMAETQYALNGGGPLTPDSKTPTVSQARLSGPSRIVFKFERWAKADHDDKDAPWARQNVSIDALTNWDALTMQVNDRAKPLNVSLSEQLRLAGGLNNDTDITEVFSKIASTFYPPGSWETALETHSRLILSPAEGMWVTPRGDIKREAVPLWNARLNRSGRQSMRAIWSHYLVNGNLPSKKDLKDVKDKLANDYVNVLTPDDHWNIVAQTSVYGLPALLRTKSKDSADPVDKALSTVARNSVIRPDGDYKFLNQIDCIQAMGDCSLTCTAEPAKILPDSGIAIPSCFGDADTILTSIGASLDARWSGDPPILLPQLDCSGIGIHMPSPFDLERLSLTTYLGRDIVVEAVKKGFLLPLGLRASYVELTERRLFRHPQYGYPVAYPIKRRFITVTTPDKEFPAVNQPYDSHDFPADRIRLLTTVTPDLVTPTKANGSMFDVNDVNDDYLVFWPMVPTDAGTPADVAFRWTVDADATPILSNLFFMSNKALSREQVMKDVADVYRGLGAGAAVPEDPATWHPRRIAKVGGVRRRYAPSDGDEGKTSFHTDAWLLSYRGRLMFNGDTTKDPKQDERFLMDARMNGADQPPAYPFLDYASVSIQSLDRLLGAPQGLVSIGFNSTYTEHGFHGVKNKSQIFGDFHGPRTIQLGASDASSKVGGFADTSTIAAALSRKTGIVGAPALAPLVHSKRLVVDARSLPPAKFDIKDALDGNFNPAKFFKDLKLCGVIELGKVLATVEIEGAPKLLERFGFGTLLENVQDNLNEEQLSNLAVTAIKKLVIGDNIFIVAATAVEAFRKKLDAEILGATGGRATLADVYPVLSDKLIRARISLEAAKARLEGLFAKPPVRLTNIADELGPPVRSADDVLKEIERTLRDPVPPLVQKFINDATVAYADLRKGVKAKFFAIGKELLTGLIKPRVDDILGKLRDSKLLPFFFGDRDIGNLINDPDLFLTAVRESLFGDVFGQPIRALLTRAREFEALVSARILWLRTAALQDLQNRFKKGIDLIESRLDKNVPNISKIAGQVDLIEQIFKRVNERIDQIILGKKFEDFAQVAAVLDLIAAENMNVWVSQAIKDMAAPFKPAMGDPNALLVEFEVAVTSDLNKIVKVAISGEVARLRAEIAALSGDARLEFLQRLLGSLDLMFDGVTSALEFSRISKAGRAFDDWCADTATDTSARAVRLAQRVSNSVAGGDADLTKLCVDFGNAIDAIQMPSGTPQDIVDEVNRRRAVLKALLGRILDMLAGIQKVRTEKWDKIFSPANGQLLVTDICGKVPDFLDPTQALLTLRRDATVLVTEAVERLFDLSKYIDSVKLYAQMSSTALGLAGSKRVAAAATSVETNIGLATAALGGLARQLTSILKIASNANSWTELKALVEALKADGTLASIGTFRTDLETAVVGLETDAKALHVTIVKALGENPVGPPDIGALAAVAGDIAAYAIERDRRVASLALQSVAFTNTLANNVKSTAAGIVRSLAKSLETFHNDVYDLIAKLIDVVQKNPVLQLVINQETLNTLIQGNKAIRADAAVLKALVEMVAEDDLATEARKLIEHWKNDEIAIERTLRAVAGIVDALLRGQLGAVISTKELSALAERARQELETIVTKLVPTRLDLSYDWQTKIPEIGGGVFSMVQSKPDDLKIRSSLSADFVSGARDYRIQGTLQPFIVNLFPGLVDIAKIKFKTGTFISQNGSSPTFDLKVDDVELGKVLQYLKPLQAWMSPKDGGFYIRPVIGGHIGIEAGYTFDSDIVTLGAISFLNVSLGVAARLFFDGKDAEFIFRFASAPSPFLISAPPYGGGGYLELRANPQKVTRFAIGCAFGACVAFRIGMLAAQGRVTVGLTIDFDGSVSPPRCIIELRFDAVGEGSIGCFGISVQISITARSVRGQSGISGTVSQKFKFKIGFFSITLGFTAAYGVSSDSSARLVAANACESEGGSCKPPTNDPKAAKIVNKTPHKRQQWNNYKQRVALGLLESAA